MYLFRDLLVKAADPANNITIEVLFEYEYFRNVRKTQMIFLASNRSNESMGQQQSPSQFFDLRYIRERELQ